MEALLWVIGIVGMAIIVAAIALDLYGEKIGGMK